MSGGTATGHMIQERTTLWKIRGVKELGTALWDLLKTLLILAQGVKSTDEPAFATEMSGTNQRGLDLGKQTQ